MFPFPFPFPFILFILLLFLCSALPFLLATRIIIDRDQILGKGSPLFSLLVDIGNRSHQRPHLSIATPLDCLGSCFSSLVLVSQRPGPNECPPQPSDHRSEAGNIARLPSDSNPFLMFLLDQGRPPLQPRW